MHPVQTKSYVVLALILFATVAVAELKPATVQAFDRYTKLSEARMQGEEAKGGAFLAIDAVDSTQKPAILKKLQSGEVVIDRLHTKDNGSDIPVRNGMIHHWRALVFVPGATIQQALALVQDYNNHQKIYSPDVQLSKLVGREGDKFHIFYRLKRQKVITVVMDTYYDVQYAPVEGNRTTSRSYSTKIQEVKNAGEATERIEPPDSGTGFMWRLNTYWRFAERDGGLYMQCEAISLSRDIPTGLGWAVGPFVESVPRESLIFTLGRTREQLLAREKKK
jgi:hypothetical protein